MSVADAVASGRFSDYVRKRKGEPAEPAGAAAEAAPVRPSYREGVARGLPPPIPGPGTRADGCPYVFPPNTFEPPPMPVLPGCPDPSGVPIPKNMEWLPRDHRGRPVLYSTKWTSERDEDIVRYDPVVGQLATFTSGKQGDGKPVPLLQHRGRMREVICKRLCRCCRTPLAAEGVGWFTIGPEARREAMEPGEYVTGTPSCAPCLRYSLQVCGPLVELQKAEPPLLHVARVPLSAMVAVVCPAFPPELFDVESIDYDPPLIGGQRLTENPAGLVFILADEFDEFSVSEFMEMTEAP